MELAQQHPDVLFVKMNGSDERVRECFEMLGIQKVRHLDLPVFIYLFVYFIYSFIYSFIQCFPSSGPLVEERTIACSDHCSAQWSV